MTTSAPSPVSKPAPPERRRGLKPVPAFAAAVVALAAAIFVLGVRPLIPLQPDQAFPWLRFALFALAFAGTEMAVVHLHVRRSAQTFSLSEVPLVIGLFFLAPQLLVLARLVGAGSALFAYRRQRSVKLAFNLGVVATETAVALVIFSALLGNADPESAAARLAAFGAAICAGLVTTLLVGIVSMLHDGQVNPTMWRRILAMGLVSFTANASLGLVAVTILQVQPSAVWYLLLVLAVVSAAYHGYSTVHRRHENLEVLYDFTRDVGAALHVDSVGIALLTRARDLLSAEQAEIILENSDGTDTTRLRLAPDETLDHVTESPELRALRLQVAGSGSVAIPRSTRVEVQRAFLDHQGVKDAVLVRLAAEGDVTGTVVVSNRLGEVLTFSPDDVRLLQTLTNHASVALANGRLVDRLTKQAAEREHEALHDPLTGLPNRTLFLRELADVIAAPHAKAAVLLMDLNGFKDVNDTLGHHAGDLLLRDVGGRLERALDSTGGLVARLGGDEFAILLPGVGGELAAKTVAHEVMAVLEKQTTIEGVRVDITASIGITLCPLHGDAATTLLRRADIAMYAAKGSHGHIQIYNPERDHHSPQRLALASELRMTVERGELKVVYQPKADLRTGRVVGVEALARWNHPDRGFVPPEEFIAVAERSGVIRELTMHVLRTTLQQCRAWRLDGLGLNVSVNVSARALRSDFPAQVAAILGETGVAAGALTLEVTESSIMADPEHTGLVLDELSAMGVNIAVDDFGTGYSSLTYLKRLPVDEIKIDKSFVLGMSSDEDDAAIVRSTVDLGRNLGLRVVAEGIETSATWTALTTLGCDMAQGYFLSPAVTPGEFDGWLRARVAAPATAPAPPTNAPALPPINPRTPPPL
jgi:diguanylate cyclase (GGDEF)-like protein